MKYFDNNINMHENLKRSHHVKLISFWALVWKHEKKKKKQIIERNRHELDKFLVDHTDSD